MDGYNGSEKKKQNPATKKIERKYHTSVSAVTAEQKSSISRLTYRTPIFFLSQFLHSKNLDRNIYLLRSCFILYCFSKQSLCLCLYDSNHSQGNRLFVLFNYLIFSYTVLKSQINESDFLESFCPRKLFRRVEIPNEY